MACATNDEARVTNAEGVRKSNAESVNGADGISDIEDKAATGQPQATGDVSEFQNLRQSVDKEALCALCGSIKPKAAPSRRTPKRFAQPALSVQSVVLSPNSCLFVSIRA